MVFIFLPRGLETGRPENVTQFVIDADRSRQLAKTVLREPFFKRTHPDPCQSRPQSRACRR